ncbi:GNAT family N-acetyltransferase [Alkalihalophilus marmarensis]|jgi:RimJ/RimL family protein N-acetyltransferase|uniref:GNAT family acetyltransferase n=1 Tax=Alkalihalophilus marmarensis DSM 21297 TaxID=1188261 RepID=U6SW77_9BACI|nr:GNAT family protein [Alkalihalophilus marmarensis]ERN54901.1 GNAT family acetyltransferase [Alkalihalophilus marmarensis DSM 21297]MCM3488479.1 GNAT family N-acetyltransferase [Alkalihalophilus marmarensis]
MVVAQEPLIMTFTAKDDTDVTLRPVQKSDAYDIITSVASIIKEGTYIQKERPRTLNEEHQFIEEMKANDNMYIVVEVNGAARGIARVVRGELEMKKHTGLFRTWLHEDAQGKGIGKKVMEYTFEWCRMHNLHKLCLTVFASNEIAITLYKKYGFVIEGTQKEQAYLNGQYDDELFMAYFFNDQKNNMTKEQG